jgi:uncharacterized protein
LGVAENRGTKPDWNGRHQHIRCIFRAMQRIKNSTISGAEGRPIALDIFFADEVRPRPLVIYAHGFNGFKDWGHFDLIAERFAEAGFCMVKFNFSHNGTTPQQPEEFVDLTAFGHNNYTRQLYDLRQVVDWATAEDNPYHTAIDTRQIGLIGHSMGGGIGILYAAADQRITHLIGWASISECKTPWGNWPPEKMAEWERTGVQYYHNGRTHQDMPLYYQLHQDYQRHRPQLDIQSAISGLRIPILLCHGAQDAAVPLRAAHQLQQWQPAARLVVVDGDHVFGRQHPWPHDYLPEAMERVVGESIGFLQRDVRVE